MKFRNAVVLVASAWMLLTAESCPPPCPVGEKCGQSPHPQPAEKCAYKMTCFYSAEANRVQISGTLSAAREPFPAVKTQISAGPAQCFLFSGSIAPEVTMTETGGQFSFGVPLNVSQAHALYPAATILAADPSGNCAPSEVKLAASVPDEPAVCTCKVVFP